MIIYCSGHVVRVEKIALFPRPLAQDYFKLLVAMSDLLRLPDATSLQLPDVRLAHQLGSLKLLMEEQAARLVGNLIEQILALEQELDASAKYFHWSEIDHINSLHVHQFRVKGAVDASAEYIHDGREFLIVREGSEGAPHKIRIAAIDMVELVGIPATVGDLDRSRRPLR